LIDTGVVVVMLPKEAIETLHLMKDKKMLVKYANEKVEEVQGYKGLMIEINGRAGTFDCIEGPYGSEPIIGVLVLERLDLMVYPGQQRLIPASGSQILPMLDMK
jgi:predicted aspartyl protease